MAIALITGGSRGLGRDMALKVAARGNDVVLTYHSNHTEAQAVVDEIVALGQRAAALQLNVEDSGNFDAFVGQVRGVLQGWNVSQFQFLVNNAGIGLHTTLEHATPEQFDQLMNIHVKGPFFLTQKLLPLLADGGRIINISTGLTRFTLPGYSLYAAAKGAVEVLSKYLAQELGARGITVNVVAPGAIATDFGGGVVRDNQQVNDMVARSIVLGRVGQPEDIGGVVASLLSPDMGWVNAQRIEASGGQNI